MKYALLELITILPLFGVFYLQALLPWSEFDYFQRFIFGALIGAVYMLVLFIVGRIAKCTKAKCGKS